MYYLDLGMGRIIKILTLWIFLLTSHVNFIFVKAIEPVVCLSGLGCIEGIVKAGNEEKYEAFYGIPFAKPPIGDLRFKNPEPPTAWSNKLLAKEPRLACIQKNYVMEPPTVSGEEDCLYLNVYRPANRSVENLPVLVFIHGGAFQTGTPTGLGPEYFMDTNEVILVMLTYRLGPFGFLSTGDEHIAGNFALKDQTMGLKWVQNYINTFGGDPKRVTIFGVSAGGSSVHLHMLSPASKGLFRNAIALSGMANGPFMRHIDEKANAIRLAVAAGISNASQLTSLELPNTLRKLNATVLLEANDALKKWYVYPSVTFRPNVEHESWPDPFLTENAIELLNNKPPQTVPWIAGSLPANGEGAVLVLKLASNLSLQAEFNQNFDERFSWVLDFPFEEKPDEVKKIIALLVEEYMGGVRELNNDTINGFLEIAGDSTFIYPLYKTVEANVKTDNAAQIPIGIMRFNYSTPFSMSSFYLGNSVYNGVAHGDDSQYLFYNSLRAANFSENAADTQVIKGYVGLHVQFAKTGTVEVFNNMPTCTKGRLEERQKKSRFCNYLKIVHDKEIFQSDSTWNIKRMKLWENVYKIFDTSHSHSISSSSTAERASPIFIFLYSFFKFIFLNKQNFN